MNKLREFFTTDSNEQVNAHQILALGAGALALGAVTLFGISETGAFEQSQTGKSSVEQCDDSGMATAICEDILGPSHG